MDVEGCEAELRSKIQGKQHLFGEVRIKIQGKQHQFVCRETICVKINNLLVPQIAKHGDPVVLDCDFSLEAVGDDELVVKWYKNKTLVYQWIPAINKRPQDLGVLKGKLNLAYAASDDTHSIHRALHILAPGPDLSGDYTCSVSTLKNEDQKTKSMLVLVTEKNLMLRRKLINEGYMEVTCKAEGVFPKPSIVLRSQERESIKAEVNVRKKGELYDVTAIAILPSLQDPEVFSCELRIPEANYTKRQETVFFPGQDSKAYNSFNSHTSCLLLLTTLYIYFSMC
ncbi:uncharacterized protein [Onthophagus taurus]|uniref:uncharacterized protein isoform X2 n=1 Tax=Onthophagus taurus TaxID=166361 RepID=UPI0039BEADAB